jgi:hypothetical protein
LDGCDEGFERETGFEVEGLLLPPPPLLEPELEDPLPKDGEVSPMAALIFRLGRVWILAERV